MRELVDVGIAQVMPGTNPARFIAERPGNEAIADLIDHFLERCAAVSTEDSSTSVQRFRARIGLGDE